MRRSFILSIQEPLKGPAISFPISESKVTKVLQIIQPEIKKKKKQMSCSSVKLDQFFT